jgi:anaerobic ribonucleoside-triphosphate reductase activating protein
LGTSGEDRSLREEDDVMNYAEIKYCDIANGTGVRTSLFVSGCTHHCKGCFNEIAWDFAYGKPYTKEVEDEIIASLQPSYIAGLSLLGGEPLEPDNQRALMPLLRRVHKEMPEKTIWCYSGYTYETDIFAQDGRAHTEVTDEFLSCLDMLVDGEFVLEKKDITLLFRGSSNQRLISMSGRENLPGSVRAEDLRRAVRREQ